MERIQHPPAAARPGLGSERLIGSGVVLVGTVWRDGTARISPVEPLVWNRDLWLSMLLDSLKARDLLRDSRLLIHSIVTGREGSEGEYKLRGRAIAEPSEATAAGYAAAVRDRIGWEPEPGRPAARAGGPRPVPAGAGATAPTG